MGWFHVILFLCDDLQERMTVLIVLDLSWTNYSRHQLSWYFLEVLSGLRAYQTFLHVQCEPGTSLQVRVTEHVQAACTVHAEQIWHYLEALGWYQIGMYVSAAGTKNTVSLRLIILPEGACTAFPGIRTALWGLIHLCRLIILGLLHGSVQGPIIMLSRLLNSLPKFTRDDCKCSM